MSPFYNCMFTLLFSTILLIKISNGSTALPTAHHNIDGIEFDIPLNKELIIGTSRGFNQQWVEFCSIIDPTTKECATGEMKVVAYLGLNFNTWLGHAKWINKMNMIVFNPVLPHYYLFDVLTFGFPCYTLYLEASPHLKVAIFVGDVIGETDSTGYSVYFEDSDDDCKDYRPREITIANMFNLHMFFNGKWAKYAYYFIKKDQYICAFAFNYKDFFEGRNVPSMKYIFPVSFSLIDNYPTENYAPNFFCVDALYGTFVSLYWNQDHPKNLPEAHFYIINEKNISKMELIDRIILKDFDQEVLKDIFNNNFDSEIFPTFSSYGRQIFVWFKRPLENRIFNGIWKNETHYNTNFQEVVNVNIYHDGLSIDSLLKLFYAKKEWIQYDRPVGRFDAPSLPPPVTVPPTNYMPPTTPKPTTSTPVTLKPTTELPSIPSTTKDSYSTSSPDSTMDNGLYSTPTIVTSNFSTVTASDDLAATSTKSNLTETNNHQSAESHNQQLPKCSDTIYNNLWFLILHICIIIIEAIILVLLIIFKYRGAKKMKKAMVKKSMHSTKKKPTPVKTKKISKKIELPKKATKKSVKEKSMTTTSDHAGKTADDKKTMDQTTDFYTCNATNYYTVNENFDKSVLNQK